MRTPLLEAHAVDNAYARAALSDAITPREAATILLDAIERGDTIAHIHPRVLTDARRRIDDHKGFIDSLQQLHRQVPDVGTPRWRATGTDSPGGGQSSPEQERASPRHRRRASFRAADRNCAACRRQHRPDAVVRHL